MSAFNEKFLDCLVSELKRIGPCTAKYLVDSAIIEYRAVRQLKRYPGDGDYWDVLMDAIDNGNLISYDFINLSKEKTYFQVVFLRGTKLISEKNNEQR
jgi:hypothetical protein